MEGKDKLMKLIRLLSSDKDGEVLAAVRGIERILKSEGKSFHELADVLAGKIVEVTKVVERVRVERVEVTVEVEHSCEEWIWAADQLIATEKLAGHELNFVRDMGMRFKLHPNYVPSPRQIKWMVDLLNRHKIVVANRKRNVA